MKQLYLSFITRILGSLFLLPPFAAALYPDEAGVIDFHHELLGLPLAQTTLFHQPIAHAKSDLLYTITDLGILGAVNPNSGGVVWRQALVALDKRQEVSSAILRAATIEPWLATSLRGSVSVWNSQTGRNLWTLEFPSVVVGLDIVNSSDGNDQHLLLAYEHNDVATIQCRKGSTGELLWSREIPLGSESLQSLTTNKKNNLYLLTVGPEKQNVRTVDLISGDAKDEIPVAISDHKKGTLHIADVNLSAPIIFWMDSAGAKYTIFNLQRNSYTELPLPGHVRDATLQLVESDNDVFTVLIQSRSSTSNASQAALFTYSPQVEPTLSPLREFSFEGNCVAYLVAESSRVFVVVVTTEGISFYDTVTSTPVRKWPVSIDPSHFVAKLSLQNKDSISGTVAIVTKDQKWVYFRDGSNQWARAEGLSGITNAAVAEIPESQDFVRALQQEAHTSPWLAYLHRISRHLSDAKHLPQFLTSIPSRLHESLFKDTRNTHAISDKLVRDTFGLRKVLIGVTVRGRIYALDTGLSGKIIWESQLPHYESSESRSVSLSVDDQNGTVRVFTSRGYSSDFHVSNGTLLKTSPPISDNDLSKSIVVKTGDGPTLFPVEGDAVLTEELLASVPLETIVIQRSPSEIVGIRCTSEDKKLKSTVSWSFQAPAGQKIVHTITRPLRDPVASLGRVLVDRSVLYKYLNPNLLVISTVAQQENTLHVYLVDSVSGEILRVSRHVGVDSSKPIRCVLSENWYLCSYYAQYHLTTNPTETLQGYHLTVTDLYESTEVNDRGRLGSVVNASSIEPVSEPTDPSLPAVLSQTWIASTPFSLLSVSQTRQGITKRQILAYDPQSHILYGIPRELVDPRRPVGRDPTREELEVEGIPRYTPALELDSRMSISHVRNLYGIQGLLAVPAVVESTSLVFAYGVDVFGTRITPSHEFDILGSSFNKIGLLGTVLVLFCGVMLIKPIVRRKQIDLVWKST